jgi:hypothetical protein
VDKPTYEGFAFRSSWRKPGNVRITLAISPEGLRPSAALVSLKGI